MESNKLFAETPPFKLFIRAALPGAIAMLASMLYDTADGILVGRYLGQESFGAVTIAIPLVILCFAVADLIGVGALNMARRTTRLLITSLPLHLSCLLPQALSAAFSSSFVHQTFWH